METVNAYIARDPAGVCRVFVKRAKYKHWFELGEHRETDVAFERALADGSVAWKPGIVDRTQLFLQKIWKKFWKYKNYPYLCIGLRK